MNNNHPVIGQPSTSSFNLFSCEIKQAYRLNAYFYLIVLNQSIAAMNKNLKVLQTNFSLEF